MEKDTESVVDQFLKRVSKIGPPPRKMAEKPYFTGLLEPFRMSRGGNSDEDKYGFIFGKNAAISRVFSSFQQFELSGGPPPLVKD